MKKYLFYFALTSWILGLLVHILSLAAVDVEEKVPFTWLLHFGIFIVWFPVVLDLVKNEELQEYKQSKKQNRMNPIVFLKILFKETPTWMKVIALAGYFYAMINFMLFFTSQGGTPSIKDGQYILHNHGRLIKILTEQEYHHFKANVVRVFSGHWILFYGVATAYLYKYSGLEKRKINANKI
jgi:hypothetical protein